MLTVDVEILYGLSFVVPLLAALLLTPLAARVARRYGILDHPAHKKHHERVTPYLGGLAAAVPLVAAGGVAAGAEGQLITVLLGGVALTIVGLVDDHRNVPMSAKLVVEMAAGIGLW